MLGGNQTSSSTRHFHHCTRSHAHASIKITRVCGERDRALIFRGWSRLCLHAASLSVAEGASAAATAVARAARAKAMEKEAEAAAEKAEAWRRAAAASAEVAGAREKAQREAARGSVVETKPSQKDEEIERVLQQQKLRRVKMLVRGGHAVTTSPFVFQGSGGPCRARADRAGLRSLLKQGFVDVSVEVAIVGGWGKWGSSV